MTLEQFCGIDVHAERLAQAVAAFTDTHTPLGTHIAIFLPFAHTPQTACLRLGSAASATTLDGVHVVPSSCWGVIYYIERHHP